MNQVLIIDDESFIVNIVKKLLKTIDIMGDSVKTGKEALEKIKETPYSLFLIDQTLSDIFGTELAEKIKKICPESKIILMSGYQKTEIEEVDNGYIDDFLFKPDMAKDLLNLVIYHLNK